MASGSPSLPLGDGEGVPVDAVPGVELADRRQAGAGAHVAVADLRCTPATIRPAMDTRFAGDQPLHGERCADGRVGWPGHPGWRWTRPAAHGPQFFSKRHRSGPNACHCA